MAYNSGNWENKEQRAEVVRMHTEQMQEKYAQEIKAAIENTKIYNTDFKSKISITNQEMKITVEELDTVHAGNLYSGNGKTALLNFSSYKNPGGMFIKGSKAQEECLCHASYLYNVLLQMDKNFYEWNRQHKGRALYLNRGMYSPNILFQYEESLFHCDVITCAAPNKLAAQRTQKVSEQENTKALQSRIAFVLDIAKENQVDTLILGAYGCGVFGQNPTEVAKLFQQYLQSSHKCFGRVVFAIPRGKDGNLEAFQKVFEKR